MRDKLIVALDVPDLVRAKELIDILDETVIYYKVGLELFLNTRGEILDYLKARNKRIFLDLKFHDIPNTVSQAAKWAASLGVDMFNVHASGGELMLAKTVDTVKNTALQNGFVPPLVIAVTVLTSFDESGFRRLGFRNPIKKTVLSWAELCQKSGLDGVVSSPQEVQDIKKVCGKEFITVCPGVRPEWAGRQDQKRIMTPKDAVKVGVDYIVVGRPITKNSDPFQAARKIIAEMEEK